MSGARRPPRSRPDRSFEAAAGPFAIVCGIDEAGRGPLAGPVVAAAVILPAALPDALAGAIDDSKTLNRARRERLLPDIRAHAVAVGVGHAEVAEIDRLNIHHATLLAMARAFTALALPVDRALVDGRFAPELPCTVETIIKGDGRSLSIAAASIVAKVERDRVMHALALEHPEYGWERNAGYPTAEHLAALVRFGPTAHHRASFAPVSQQLALSV